jgi:hypothetical protein
VRATRTITRGIGGNSVTTCGLILTPSGVLTVGVQAKLAQLLPSGRVNNGFAPRGVFRTTRPKQVFINAVVAFGTRRIVVAGSAGNDIYVARYLLQG